tara:strand:+ start:263 stop:889 length:627 start_codon:yes stop_codon:yes gene_type:complete
MPTVIELRKLARDHNIKGRSKMNKAQLMNSLNKKVSFKKYKDFKPNLTPRQVIKLGSFGGTYWRPIQSDVTGMTYKNKHKVYPKTWWKGIPEDHMTRSWENYDKNINKYKVKVGTTLEFWESKNWITAQNPYGWFQWYCDYYNGKRGPDDERQVSRWIKTAGPNSRFRKRLMNMIKKKGTTFDDESVSPKIRQTLQHWGVKLTAADLK